MQNSKVSNGQSYCGGTELYGTRISRPEYQFIKELLLGASGDSPTEIREWCKSDLCRRCCDWMGIDINDYRKGMLRIVLDKKEEAHPRIKTHADDYMGPEEDEQKAPDTVDAAETAETADAPSAETADAPSEEKTDAAEEAAANTLVVKNADTFESVSDIYSHNHAHNYAEETDELELGPLFKNAFAERMAAR